MSNAFEGIELLSRDDELQVLSKSFLPHIPHRQKLFPVDAAFYNALGTADGIVACTRELYRWLGTKPAKVAVNLGPEHAFKLEEHTLFIPNDLLAHPYQLGSRLALVVLADVLRRKLRATPADSLVETASIEVGFGCLVLNGMSEHVPFTARWHAGFHDAHPVIQHLDSYSPQSYAVAFAKYTHSAKIDPESFFERLSAAAQKLLPGYYGHHQLASRVMPAVLRQRHRQARLALIKVIGFSLLCGSIVSIGIFIYAQRPYTPSRSVQKQYTKVQSLEHAYKKCTDKVQQEQNTYQQDDIFKEQAINGDLAKCVSLQNQYNYEVGVYNQMVDSQ